ncbi:MAG: DUF1998 domain-containing protein [Myxococcales bacterium]|nr:DUF1998 domain-containing protein [Myxococcales bacterium]
MKPKIHPTGELRRSQVLTTFGPGAMLDLPKHSVLVGGLEYWHGDKQRIFEDRLQSWLCLQLKVPELKLFAPPVDSGEEHGPPTGIDVFLFPGWFLGQVDETWRAPDGRRYRTRPLIPWERLVDGGYLTRDRKIKPVVPVRLVQACVRGHLSDVDWYGFVRHDYKTERTGDLWFDEGGAGNDFAELYIRDERNGNQRRPLSEAMVPDGSVLGWCQGRSPWLGPRVKSPCDRPNRLLVRSASNAYFSQTVSVISLPDRDQALRSAVDRVWEDFLKYCENEADVRRERRKEKVQAALEGFSDALVWADVERRLAGSAPVEKGIKQVEIETLLAQRDTLGEDQPEGDFYARAHPLGALPRCAAGKLDRLVLVHRLREVSAQVGFTRFESTLPDINGELDLKVELAPLARDLTWLPANENRGEGVFLSFPAEAITAWQRRPGVQRRRDQLLAGFEVWKQRKRIEDARFPGLPYILLQSLSHLLITTLSLDCGYSASSIRERVYATESGYGILLYTGTSGSEGSLGGLVEMGKHIGRHLEHALELGRLCSNDPVCSQHNPADPHEERFLHGAACHGCLLIAETSCERHNELLDRALVVPTVATADAAFFCEGT